MNHNINFEAYFTEYDPSYKLVFHAEWSDYEENGWIFIFWKNKEYFTIEGGYGIMQEDHNDRLFPLDANLFKVSEQGAFELMLDWERVL